MRAIDGLVLALDPAEVALLLEDADEAAGAAGEDFFDLAADFIRGDPARFRCGCAAVRLGLGCWIATSTRSPSRAVPVSRRAMWTRLSATRSRPVARLLASVWSGKKNAWPLGWNFRLPVSVLPAVARSMKQAFLPSLQQPVAHQRLHRVAQCGAPLGRDVRGAAPAPIWSSAGSDGTHEIENRVSEWVAGHGWSLPPGASHRNGKGGK